jgi:undecaprenyl-diphosphatase
MQEKEKSERIKKRIGLMSLDMAIVLLSFFGSLFLVAFLVKAVFYEELFVPDQEAFAWLEQFVSPQMNSIMEVITYLGSAQFLTPDNLILMAFAFFVEKDRWLGIKVASIALTSLLLMFLLKLYFGRPRPEIPLLEAAAGLSFPSGHAFMSFTFYGLLAYFLYREIKRRWLRLLCVTVSVLLILLIGFSRIYLRVHYLSDVLAGMAVGVIWLTISLAVLNKLENRKKVTTDID